MKKKTEKGTHDYALTKNKKVIAIRWMDNSVVTVGSTICGVHPLSNASCYSSVEKKKCKSLGRIVLQNITNL